MVTDWKQVFCFDKSKMTLRSNEKTLIIKYYQGFCSLGES